MAHSACPRPRRPGRPLAAWTAALVAAWLASGCASVTPESTLAPARQSLAPLLDAHAAAALQARPAPDAQAPAQVDALLARPLDANAALTLALLHSPALQALLARHAAEAADAVQGGRLANPLLSLERLRGGGELEIARSLSVGLLDLLTWPQRLRGAEQRQSLSSWRLAAELVDQVSAVRGAWVEAVAARQALAYARQVQESAEAGAELARRMQSAGNFNASAGARQRLFAADAQVALASAEHQALASREALVRALGLNDDEARRLTLPEQLPPLPATLPAPAELLRSAAGTRLDLRLARAELDAAAADAGWSEIASWTDVELTARLNSLFDGAGPHVNQRGAELAIRLPLFDAGDARRQAQASRVQAAAWQLQATERAAGSQLREAESAWRSAWAVARQYREQLVPLRKTLADESLLRYNGMLIGVFELLADAREQAATVQAAIAAEARYWRSDAALQAQLLGRPLTAGDAPAAPRGAAAPAPDGH